LIVFCLEWHGNKLLFTGDAEELSWETLYQKDVLKEVDFLKISHHGSENGTSPDEILEKFSLKIIKIEIETEE
jgi:beta-lactamase superfamily II metal-dependent hydrolase